MSGYVPSALFVYGEESAHLLDAVNGNTVGADITPVALGSFLEAPERYVTDQAHVVVAAELADIKTILSLARQHGFSVGLLPSKSQKQLRACYDLPADPEALVNIALRDDPPVMDLILLNDQVMLFNAVLGRLPLLEAGHDHSRIGLVLYSFWRMLRLKLQACTFTLASGRRIDTAACGCMIVQKHEGSLASRLVARDSSFSDGLLSLVIAAPMSVMAYARFLAEFLSSKFKHTKVPSTLGYIKNSRIDIETQPPVPVLIDGVPVTQTPLHGEVQPEAVRINVGDRLRKELSGAGAVTERVEVKNLPQGRELSKVLDKHIPLFGYASEDRFRDLFLALREDARITGTYVILMILSTLLATVGLFLSSSSVVIGAMLLAPLMAPIVSLAMGIVRQDDRLAVKSIKKTIVGVLIALTAAALFSLLITHKPVTPEMQARLNPTLLDLAVAILAGIAGAYTKSFKEILQSLAGVAIAVALVPPLAVAGIGLGRADFPFFFQAFLLFSTNLIGITLAGALTFRILGYSPVVRNKRGMAVVAMLLVLISVPLMISYRTIVETQTTEKAWQQERFLVGGKYLIVEKAELRNLLNHDVLYVNILAREPMDRSDLAEFKEKIQRYFSRRLIVRVKVTYIL